jgi:5-(carboxyamino)imidazole ribonucleotide mutase
VRATRVDPSEETPEEKMDTRMKPLVAVLMGSDSDLSTMVETSKVLDRFGVAHTMRITSAHRSPAMTHEIVKTLEAEGVEVFVVGAGLAAHLAGAVAGVSARPVIGVPMGGGSLQGVDALYSTVQMPGGVPVATMAIGKHGAKNAGVLAVQILALKDEGLRSQLEAYKEELARSVEEKDRKLSAELGGAGGAAEELAREGSR